MIGCRRTRHRNMSGGCSCARSGPPPRCCCGRLESKWTPSRVHHSAGTIAPAESRRNDDGSYRAECQEVPSVCESVELVAADIAVLTLDMSKLVDGLVKALDLTAATNKHRAETVALIGQRMLNAGRGIPVFMAVQDQSKGSSIEIFKEIADATKPALLLVPTSETLCDEQKRYLDKIGASVRTCDEFIEFDSSAGLVATAAAEDCITKLVEQLGQATARKHSGPRLSLPADAKWEEITFEFRGRCNGPCKISRTDDTDGAR